MRRREFITLIGGAAAVWPLAARAQQTERVRHIGVLMPAASDDLDAQARIAAFRQGLRQLGWTDRPQSADRYRAGARAMLDEIPQITRRNWPRSRRMSSWSLASATLAPLLQATRVRADRVRERHRPGRRWFRREAWHGRAATRPGSRLTKIQHERKMAGAAQRDRAPRDARGGPSGSRPSPPGSGSSALSRS